MYAGSKCETRFMYINNLAYSDVVSTTAEVSGFPATNLLNNSRSTFYIPQELFTIDSTNKTLKFKVGAGADTTVNLTEANYTASGLATHLQSVLSNGFTVEYVTASKRFRIKNASTFTLYLTDNPISWAVIGFTSLSDLSGLATTWYSASEPRRHTSIRLVYDLGASAVCGFFALLGEKNKTFSLSPNAIVNVKLNTINDEGSSPINANITATEAGCFSFLDSLVDYTPSFRYCWITIDDNSNLTASEFVFSHLFLGPYTSFENRTINNGFNLQWQDRSIKTESVSGGLFFERYGRVPTLGGLDYSYLTKEQALELQQLSYDLGKSTHLYLSLDSGRIYNDVSVFTFYGCLDDSIQIQRVPPHYYNASFSFRGD